MEPQSRTWFDFDSERAITSLDEAAKTLTRVQEKARILNAAMSALCDRHPEFEPEDGAYGYIPVDVSDFMESIFTLEDALCNDPDYRHSDLAYRPCAFLEIGCGPGRNIFLLKSAERFHFHKLSGMDIAETYIEHGRTMFGLEEELFVGDARTFDYGGYDVLMFYRPFHEEELEVAFENHLIETMKRGAYLLAFSSSAVEQSRLMMRVDDHRQIFKRL